MIAFLQNSGPSISETLLNNINSIHQFARIDMGDKMITIVKNVYYKPEEDIKISISIMSPFVVLIVQSFILYYFNAIDTSTGVLVQLSSKVVVGLIYLYSLNVVLRRRSKLFILAYSVSIVIFSLNYLYFRQNAIFLNDILFQFFFVCLPSFIYSSSVKSLEILNDVVEKVSFLVFIVGMIIGLLVLTRNITIGTYNMSLGYYMLLPAVIYLNKFFGTVSIKYLFLAILSIFIILAIGSRGPIMSIGIYIIINQIINFKKITIKNLLFTLSISILAILGILYLEQIFIVLINIMDDYGISSRSISLFMQEEVYLSGREAIYEEILYQIKLHPITGIGIAGDRLYTGTYSHNIILEIISGFGVVVGSMIIIVLTTIITKLMFSKDIEGLNKILIWLIVGIVPMFVSGSYLTRFQFWIFLGLAVRFLRGIKYSNKKVRVNIV